MKNKITCLLTALFIVLTICSCTDNDNEHKTLSGKWNYKNPHFTLEYEGDSVGLNMGPLGYQAMAIKDINRMFPVIAHEKMSEYFKGIDFRTGGEMMIYMEMGNGIADSLKASYKQDRGLIGVTLDAADMERLTGSKISIPEISFHCLQEQDNLILYFDKAYVQFISQMMLDKLLDMMLPAVIPNYDKIPPMGQIAMKASMKEQINGVLFKTQKLEIGVNMSR